MQLDLPPRLLKEFDVDEVSSTIESILPPNTSERDAMALVMKHYRGAYNPELLKAIVVSWTERHAA